MASEYDKAVSIETMREDAEAILAALNAATPDDAANALGIAVAQIFAQYSAKDRLGLLSCWFEFSVKPAVQATIPGPGIPPAGRSDA